MPVMRSVSQFEIATRLENYFRDIGYDFTIEDNHLYTAGGQQRQAYHFQAASGRMRLVDGELWAASSRELLLRVEPSSWTPCCI